MSTTEDTAQAFPKGSPPPPPTRTPPGAAQVVPVTPINRPANHLDTRVYNQAALDAMQASQQASFDAGVEAERQRTFAKAKEHDEVARQAYRDARQAFDDGDGHRVIAHTQRWLEYTGKADALRESIGVTPQ